MNLNYQKNFQFKKMTQLHNKSSRKFDPSETWTKKN